MSTSQNLLMNPPKASASNVSENLNDFWLANSSCWRDCRALGPVGWMWAMVSQWGRHPVTPHWANPPDQSAVCQASIKVRLHRSLPRPLYYLGARECSVDELGSGIHGGQGAKVTVETHRVSCYFYMWNEKLCSIQTSWSSVVQTEFRQSWQSRERSALKI